MLEMWDLWGLVIKEGSLKEAALAGASGQAEQGGPGEDQHAEGSTGQRRRESRDESVCRGRKGAGLFMVGCTTLGYP